MPILYNMSFAGDRSYTFKITFVPWINEQNEKCIFETETAKSQHLTEENNTHHSGPTTLIITPTRHSDNY